MPGPVILVSNFLYGATYSGGASDNGTVYRINADGTGYTNLHSFSALSPTVTNGDGAHPAGAFIQNSALVLSGSVLYGTTFSGGRLGIGTIFSINTDGSGFTNLHDFATSEGGAPNAGLIVSGNMLYGAASEGGAPGSGTLFKINTNGTAFVVLHEFTAATGDYFTNSDGVQPVAALLLSGNILYGTAQAGGSEGVGTVFAINTDGSGFTNLHNFSYPPINGDGYFPAGTLVLSGNTLYGTASAGGSNDSGMLFSVNTNGSHFSSLFSFSTNGTGTSPEGGLILSGNTLFGTATAGGRFGNGTLFAVNTNGSNFEKLYDFSLASGPPNSKTNGDGSFPSASLVLSGNTLYGTAGAGGDFGHGTLFSLSLPQTPQLTISLSGPNLILSWPTNATGFVLQFATNLTAPVIWSPAGSQNPATNLVAGSQQFYRLIR